MGHQRLGQLPRTRQWKQVVALIEHGAGAAQVANETIRAAKQSLESASDDPRFVSAFWLLCQIPLAARSDDFNAALRDLGVEVPDGPSLLDIATAISPALDQQDARRRTDLGEIAELSASEILIEHIGDQIGGLFDPTPAQVQKALRDMGTMGGFSRFQRAYFARIAERLLDYYLSRELPNHIGDGSRFATLADCAAFTSALHLHCTEASRIIEDFSGEWFSKRNWVKGGIAPRDASGFVHVAMQKMSSELRAGASDAE